MEVTETVGTETSSTPEVKTETPVSSPVETPNSTTDGAEASTPEALPVPAYVPDYKLKVYDQEKELNDPFLKALIKDADSEKKVKEIAQKFLGFDTIKEKHEKQRGEFQTYQQQTQPIVQVYQQYNKLAAAGDLEGILQLLKVPDDAIFKYAIRKAEEAQLPPQQQYEIQQQKQFKQKAMTLEEQNQQLQSSHQEQLNQFRAQELNWVMSRPDVHGTAQSFDAKNGPGAFRQFVIDTGLAHHARTQGREDLSAEQSVQEVMKRIGAFVTQAQPGQTPTQPLIQQNAAPPIIPNVVGRGSSPVKKKMTSLDDLKAKAREIGRASS